MSSREQACLFHAKQDKMTLETLPETILYIGAVILKQYVLQLKCIFNHLCQLYPDNINSSLRFLRQNFGHNLVDLPFRFKKLIPFVTCAIE